jgi:hypothetical protein
MIILMILFPILGILYSIFNIFIVYARTKDFRAIAGWIIAIVLFFAKFLEVMTKGVYCY